MKGRVQKMSKVVKITKLKKKAKSHVGILSFLLVVAIICFFLMSPIFSIEGVSVSGNKKVSSDEIISASKLVYGQNIMQIDKYAIKDRVYGNPYIKDIIIKRVWPNHIKMIIEEKNPIAETIFYGSKLLIDENGYVLEVVTDNFQTDFAVLEGLSVSGITTGEKLECAEKEKLEYFLEILKNFNNNDMLNKVQKLLVKDNAFLVFLKEGHVVNLGENIDNLQYKVLLLNEIIVKETNAVYIDLSNLDMIVTKPVWGMFNEEKDSSDTLGSEISEE